MKSQDTEPTPQGGTIRFEAWDFEALAPERARNPEFNEPRLAARRRLLALGKAVVPRAAALGARLEARTSLHHPHAFNGMSVKRLWTYLTRGKAEKARLRRVLGRELGKDLDSAYRNAYLCIALEREGFEVSLRIHQEAWYDGQNLLKRVGKEGARGWLALLNELGGFHLKLHDWKGEWPCGALSPERLDEFLRFWKPGEHQLAIERRYPVPLELEARRAILERDWAGILTDEVLRLVPMLRFAAWSEESDHLFA